ncbi:glycosyltransferase family 4 protein [Ornithinimicrobium cerasi]|nr:glycosyltransferase family 4 protein [Ornithinimicrobium cerasi]
MLEEASTDLEQIAAYSMADLLLVNAKGEGANIRHELGVVTPTRIVPNAVNTSRFSPYFESVREARSLICVGRLEPHKNQLGLIKALKGVDDVKITIVGPDHPDHPRYRDACRRAAGANVSFLPNVQHEQLAELYAAHRVHALPSWYETTGLVSLEAAAAGCAVVTTDRGHAREYFGSDAWYCDPAHPASIRDAVLQALQHGPSAELARRVATEFSWEETARQTLAGYRYVLERGCPEPRARS